jgi:hypothetical protein
VVVVAVVLVMGVFAWGIANRLSADAIGMALGLGFGVLAGLPAALLVLVASRRRAPWEEDDDEMGEQQRTGYLPYGGQAPVVIVTAGAAQQSANGAAYNGQDAYAYPPAAMQPRPALPGPTHQVGQPRVFRMIGEADEYIEE